MAMVGTSIIAVALAAGLIALTRGHWRGAALLLTVLMCWSINRDPIFFLLPMLFMAIAAKSNTLGRRAEAALLLLALAMAVSVLVKGTFAATAVVGLAGGCTILLLRRRSALAAAIAITVPAGVCAAWLLAQQPFSGLPRFFFGEGEITAGYTDAMSLSGPAWPIVIALFGVATLLLLNMRAFLRAGRPGAILAAGTAALLFLAFKAGFVRQDGHIAITGTSLAFVAFILAFVNPGRLPTLGLAVAMACAFTLDNGIEPTSPKDAMNRVAERYAGALHGAIDRLQGGPALQAANDGAIAALRAKYPLPHLTGTSDIYSVGQSMLLASGLPWSPRPVLQSYVAYTPALADADARHLEGATAPDNILLRLDPLDGQLPSIEDGPSWLPLLARYDVTSMLGETVLLHKRTPDPPQVSLLRQKVGPARHSLNVSVPIQYGDAPLWAWIDVEPTVWGRIASTLFKSPPVTIDFALRNGATASYRFIPGMAKAGFMLAPLIIDSAHLFASEIPGHQASADSIPISFTINGNAAYWRNTYLLTTASMALPLRPDAVKTYSSPMPTAIADDKNAKCWLDAIDGNIVDHATPYEASGPTQLAGWAYGGGTKGIAPDSIKLTLQALDGTVSAFSGTLLSRVDVAAYAHQPQLSDVGFRVLADFRHFHGMYQLGTEITSASHSWYCHLGDLHIAGKN